MEGLIHISFAKIDFHCPHCKEQYSDDEDKYLDRCNANRSGWTKIKCKGCKRTFGMTYDMMGDAVGFNHE
jgi:transposase-like protein